MRVLQQRYGVHPRHPSPLHRAERQEVCDCRIRAFLSYMRGGERVFAHWLQLEGLLNKYTLIGWCGDALRVFLVLPVTFVVRTSVTRASVLLFHLLTCPGRKVELSQISDKIPSRSQMPSQADLPT